MLTWTKTRAFVSWQIGIWVFYLVFTVFTHIYANFPEKYAQILLWSAKSGRMPMSGYLLYMYWKTRAFPRDSWAMWDSWNFGFGFWYAYLLVLSQQQNSKASVWYSDTSIEEKPRKTQEKTKKTCIIHGKECWLKRMQTSNRRLLGLHMNRKFKVIHSNQR